MLSFADLLSLKHDVNTLIVIIFGVFLSLIMDKIGHIMKFISIQKLSAQISIADDKLNKSEAKFGNFFNQMNIPMCIFDLKTKRFVACNPFLCNLLEYTEEELLQMNINSLIYKDDLSQSLELIKINLNQQKIDSYTNRNVTKSGKIVIIKWIFTKGDEDGISYCIAIPHQS